MADLIDRAAIHHSLVVELVRCIRDSSVDKGKMSERVLDCVDAAPAVETETVKHGRWMRVDIAGEDPHECSYCGDRVGVWGYRYCPNCGADMRGER